MGKVKNLVIMALIGVVSLGIVGSKMLQKTPEAVQKQVLAKVGDETVTRGELDKLLAPMYAQVQQQYGANYMQNPEVKQQIVATETQQLQTMIQQDTILQMAKKLGTVPQGEEKTKLEAEVKNQLVQSVGGQQQFDAMVKQSGMTQDEINKQVTDSAIIQNTLDKKVYNDIKVTPEEAQKYYNDNKAQFTKKPGADVSHILVKTKAEAEKLEKQLKDGANFAELAKKYSQDPGSAAKGGSLGYVDYGTDQLVKPFVDAMDKLKTNGAISPPVQSQFGWHIIKVENVNLKDQVVPFKTVEKQIESQLTQQKQQEAFTATIKKWEDELGAKVYTDRLS